MLPRVVKFTEIESKMMVARGSGEGALGSCCSVGTEFQFYNMKGVLGDLVHNNMNVLEAVELCT